MPARDIIHGAVKAALIKDGWTITHDPFYLELDEKYGFVDLAAERCIAAQKEEQKLPLRSRASPGGQS
jgi:hypothetical protein